MRSIPYGRQSLDQEDVSAVMEVMRGDWLTQGPAVPQFEAALAERCGAKYAVAVANGTVALHLACLAADFGPEQRGVTTPITFLASANCMLYAGGEVAFADIDARTWNLDPLDVEGRIDEHTRLVIPVDFAGLPCDLAAFRALADRHSLVLIEDACHALGGMLDGAPIGGTGYADMTCLSFHPVKQITTGEGGAVLTDDSVLAKRLRRLRHHGIIKDVDQMRRNDGPWYYEVHELGLNGRITDLQCALGKSQLRKLDAFIKRRREIADCYREALKDVPGLTMQADFPGASHAHHLFVIHLEPTHYSRREVFEGLQRAGIHCQVHYVPVHQQPLYQGRGGMQRLPRAEAYYAGCMSLPMFVDLASEEQTYVIDTLAALLDQDHVESRRA